MKKTCLAVIPARGGSVAVPRKNIALLADRPLLDYTIDQALEVDEIDLVVVSTDDIEIADIARRRGVRVIERPAELATAEAATEPVILHALDSLSGEAVFDYVMVLEPTSPFRTPETIRKCLLTITESNSPSLVKQEPALESL